MRSSVVLSIAPLVLVTLMSCTKESPSTAGTPEGPATPGADGGKKPGSKNDGATDAPPGDPGRNRTVETIDVDGTDRTFVLTVPSTYDDERSYPLIVALHGDGQSAEEFVGFSKLEEVTGQDAIVAYTHESVDLFTPYEWNNDQRMIEVIIDAMKTRFSIDESKIWGFGYSKGAYQLNEIACKRPGLLKAMAIHAGGAPQERDENGAVDCPQAIGLATFVTHGEWDDPGGGLFAADYWASRASCDGSRSPSTPEICEAYDGCDPGRPVVFCVVPEWNHYPMYGDAAAHSWAWFRTL